MNVNAFMIWAVKAYISAEDTSEDLLFYDPTSQDWIIKNKSSNEELPKVYQQIVSIDELFDNFDKFVIPIDIAKTPNEMADKLLDCVFSFAKKVDKIYHPELY